MGDVYKMSQSNKKWTRLFKGEYQSIWETPKDKDGDFDYVFSSRGVFVYFNPKEFSELMDGFREISDSYKPNGDCYR